MSLLPRRSALFFLVAVTTAIGCHSIEIREPAPATPSLDESPTATDEPTQGPPGQQAPTPGAPSETEGAACSPPGVTLSVEPTPGRCAGNTAVTCNAATSRERLQACGPSARCETFELDERKFDRDNGTGYLPSRKYTWAACVPKNARACTLSYDRGAWLPEVKPANTCEGDARARCDVPNRPKYRESTTDGWQLSVGAARGYIQLTPCPSGETCRAAISGDSTECFPKSAATCAAGAPARCASGGVMWCYQTYGYELFNSCLPSQTCGSGCDGRNVCLEAAAPSCDPSVRASTCSSSTSYEECSTLTCRSASHSCASVTVLTPTGIQNVPGRCEVLGGVARCIRAVDVLCDPAAFVERCDGTTAVQCVDGLERGVDCSTSSRVCGTNSGKAGCRAPAAPLCAAGSASACSGAGAVGCCPSSGVSPFVSEHTTPCVPGYEFGTTCKPPTGLCRAFPGLGADCTM